MNFDTYFRACSYAMIASGVVALVVSGGVGVELAVMFAAMMAASWKLAGSRWQLSERTGMFIVLLALPAFYLDWTFQKSGVDAAGQVYAGVSALTHFTLLLSSIKLLQVKSDRDWLFLYLISFFEVLLAAGLSASPAFLLTLGVYVFCALLAVICFELRKASRSAPEAESRLLIASDPKFLWRKRDLRRSKKARTMRRLPVAALSLFLLIFVLALPIFLVTPRAAESVLGVPGGAASTGFTGFSDSVTLGDIGRLNESNQLVMRVRIESRGATGTQKLRWRGIALDHFDGRRWSQSGNAESSFPAFDGSRFLMGTTEDISRVTTQTFFVEPIDTPVIFAAPRALAVQGAFQYLRRDRDEGITARPHPLERITYSVLSDTFEPPVERLRADRMPDPSGATPNLRRPVEDYLQLPSNLDTRVGSLAWTIINQAGARSTYDAARAVEAHLNRNEYGGRYGYSLQMRASGPDPLADFLFNVREGHCEYFATAMAIMLRTQRIPARIVNGFTSGEYNAAADAFTVRQADAHSWVEVYFSEADAWVAFDPTPSEGRAAGSSGSGLTGSLRRYADALELFWIQHVLAYDRQGQRTLARTIQDQIGAYRVAATESADDFNARFYAWWNRRRGGVSGALGLATSPVMLWPGAALLVVVVFMWMRRKNLFNRDSSGRGANAAVVEFYRCMTETLEARGLRRREDQTPLEFARTINTPEVTAITNVYNRVRFGAENLSGEDAEKVETWLRQLKESETW